MGTGSKQEVLAWSFPRISERDVLPQGQEKTSEGFTGHSQHAPWWHVSSQWWLPQSRTLITKKKMFLCTRKLDKLSIGHFVSLKFSWFYFVFKDNFPNTSPWGAYIFWRGNLHLSGCVLFTSFFSQKLIFNSLPTFFFNPFSPMVIVRGIASKKPFTKPFSAMERQGWMYLSITARAVKSLGAVTTSYEDFPLTTMWADVRWRQALTTTDSLQQKFPAAIPFHG